MTTVLTTGAGVASEVLVGQTHIGDGTTGVTVAAGAGTDGIDGTTGAGEAAGASQEAGAGITGVGITGAMVVSAMHGIGTIADLATEVTDTPLIQVDAATTIIEIPYQEQILLPQQEEVDQV